MPNKTSMPKSKSNAALLHQMYSEGDSRIRLLYKYRSCSKRNLDILSVNGIWLSSHEQLNDPFDCLLRIPVRYPKRDMQELARALEGAPPYRLEIRDHRDAIEYISRASVLQPLDCIGILASQMRERRLLGHIREVRASDSAWLDALVDMCSDVHMKILHGTGIFSLSEIANDPLLWAHYGASHSGFCVGYASPVGIDSPRNIYRVRYFRSVPMLSPLKIVVNTQDVMGDLILTKPSAWRYEREWRVSLGTMRGRVTDWLAPRRIIFGARIKPHAERALRKAVASQPIEFLRVVPTIRSGRFRLDLHQA